MVNEFIIQPTLLSVVAWGHVMTLDVLFHGWVSGLVC